MKYIIVSVMFLFLFAMAANADGLTAGQYDGNYQMSGSVTTVPVYERVFPRDVLAQGKKAWLNCHSFYVYSRTGHNGLQTDFIPVGEAWSKLFIKRGVICVRRCGNEALIFEVDITKIITVPGRQEVIQPAPPAPAQLAPQVTNNNVTYNFGATQQVGSQPIGGACAPLINNTQLAQVSVTPPTRIYMSQYANLQQQQGQTSVNVNGNGQAANLNGGNLDSKVDASGKGLTVVGGVPYPAPTPGQQRKP